jgi:glycogen debranching enzyme
LGDRTGVERPTPANPMPGTTEDSSLPRPDIRHLPPDLGPDAIAVSEGRTFMYSDAIGDVPPGSIGGLVNADTRLLNRWMLTINGARLLALRSGVLEPYRAAFVLTNADLPGLRASTIGVRRSRLVCGGFQERIELQSFAGVPVRLVVRLAVGTDFADLFEIRTAVQNRSPRITREHADDGSRLAFHYRNGDFEAHTCVDAYPPAHRVDRDDLVWDLWLEPGELWACHLDVPLVFGPREENPPCRDFAVRSTAAVPDPVLDWWAQAPRVDSDSSMVVEIGYTSTLDLMALRIPAPAGDKEIVLPAAGLPWFLSVFGRDTLITTYQTISHGPTLARGALLALAHHQGTKVDDFTDEEPGRILHELRTGELTRLGQEPHGPYYGTSDATQLWLIMLSEYWRWTGDDDLVRALRPNAMAALDWIDRYGDLDGDGYVEYRTRSPRGLGNQCWRDSWDGVQFADGRIPTLPIATCELQGYVYDAKLRLAELAAGPLDDPALAERLRAEAAALRDRFNEDFWLPARGGYYAIGLDGDKQPIDSLTSNIGHLLWSGIVPADRAVAVADQLMSPALFSGWGVRTLSTDDAGYNPIGYHTGSVWPHDNSLVAAGLARYGFREQANRVSMALFSAASRDGYRLPEAFSGYPRAFADFPVPYPAACSPQAWASGTPLLCMRAMLGLDARDGRVTVDPRLPDGIGRVSISGLTAFGTRWDVEAAGPRGHVRLSPL